jgi:hypothetical protein
MNARGGPGNTGAQPLEFTLRASNVSQLALEWTGSAQATNDLPVVADINQVFAGGFGLSVFAADGGSQCTGSPKSCLTLWTGNTGAQIVPSPVPALSGTSVFVVVPTTSTFHSQLAVFDEQPGATCSGSPLSCDPIWTAALPLNSNTTPTVTGGRVYVSTPLGLDVFDAAGQSGCSGSPKVCTPLWTASDGTVTKVPATVADGRVYVPSQGFRVHVYDANGVDGCTGSPVVCKPLFEFQGTDLPVFSGAFGPIAVTDGKAYGIGQGLEVFDATGTTNCSGSPKVCLRLWRSSDASAPSGVIAVANGHVFGVHNAANSVGELESFDAAGVAGCSGLPTVCDPQWIGHGGPVNAFSGGPSVANGVVYVASGDAHLYSFDAAGCPGNVCNPLDNLAVGASDLPVVIVNGRVFVQTDTELKSVTLG